MLSRTLHLTTPLMAGGDVAELQAQLVGSGWLHGPVDGIYGALTAQASHRAKFWLGYLRPDQTAGPRLSRLLSGRDRPTLAMIALAKKRTLAARRKQQGALTRGQRVVQKALSQLGVKEDPPNSNEVRFSRWYGLIGPWCAMFVTWAYVTADAAGKTFRKGSRYAFVPFVVADARAGRNGLMIAPAANADGLLACFDWDRDGVADHIGIVCTADTLLRLAPHALEQAIAREGTLGPGDFWSCEGNTSPTTAGSQSNGGMVALRRRLRANVLVFAKVAA